MIKKVIKLRSVFRGELMVLYKTCSQFIVPLVFELKIDHQWIKTNIVSHDVTFPGQTCRINTETRNDNNFQSLLLWSNVLYMFSN